MRMPRLTLRALMALVAIVALVDFPTNGGRWVNGLSGSFVLGR